VIDDEHWIFEVPVYRLSEDAWLDDLTRRVDRRVEAALGPYPEHEREHQRRNATVLAQQIEAPYSWPYNEIIAWIRLKSDGDFVKAYPFDVQRESFRRGFTPFPFEGHVTSKVFETWIDDAASNPAIHAQLRGELTALTRPGGDYEGRYLDLRVFDAIGPHVDWHAVLGLRG
jgi:hypothetical protein